MTSERLTSIWLELIQRHALLAATVEYNSLEDMRFWSVVPRPLCQTLTETATIPSRATPSVGNALLRCLTSEPTSQATVRLTTWP